MNFYFCEGCGKRISDKDIEAGEGKNKQLKGVYCRNCAVGVMTMESLPLSEEAARQLLATSEGPTPGSANTPSTVSERPAHRRTTASRIIPGSRQAPAPLPGPPSKALIAAPGRRLPLPLPLVLGAATLGLGLLLLALLMPGTPPPPRAQGPAAPPAEPLDPLRQTSALPENFTFSSVPNSTPETPLQGSSKATVPGTAGQEQPASSPQEAFARLEAAWARLAPGDLAARSSLAEAFLEAHRETAEAAKVRDLLEGWRKASVSSTPGQAAGGGAGIDGAPDPASGLPGAGAKSPAATRDSEQARTSDPAARAGKSPQAIAPAELGAHETAFLDRLDPLLGALAAQDLAKATPLASALATAQDLGEWQSAAAALPEAVGALQRQQAARLANLKKLIGQKVDLQTSGGPRKGMVSEVSAADLTLEQRFVINGREKGGVTVRVPWSSIPAEALERLAPMPKPAEAPDFAAAALGALALRALPSAEELLRHCAGHALAPPLLAYLSRAKAAAAEQAAREAWERLRPRLQGEPGPGQLDRLLAELTDFEAAHKATAYAQGLARERAQLRDELERKTLRSAKLITDLFRGSLIEYDQKTGLATLAYDFKRPEQLADFRIARGATAALQAGVLEVSSKVHRLFSLERFDLDTFKLSFRIGRPHWDAGGFFWVLFGNPQRWGLNFFQNKVGLHRLNPQNSEEPWVGAQAIQELTIDPPAGEYLLQLKRSPEQLEILVNGKTLYSASDSESLTGHRIGCWGRPNLPVRIREFCISAGPSKAWLKSQLLLQNALTQRSGTLNAWLGKESEGKWSDPKNWSLQHSPRKGERVYFCGGSVGNGDCVAGGGEVAGGLGALLIADQYTGRLIFNPGFGEGNSQTLEVNGPLLAQGGEWIVSGLTEGGTGTGESPGAGESGPRGVTIRTEAFLLGPSAVLHASHRGFPSRTGPPVGTSLGWMNGDPNAPCTLGSGGGAGGPNGGGAGGGAIKIESGEEITIEGRLAANGEGQSWGHYHGGGGGSLYLLGKSLHGSGRIEALGGAGAGDPVGGCGGRIAVAVQAYEYQGTFDCQGGPHSWDHHRGREGSLVLPPGIDLTVTRSLGLPPGQHRFGNLVIRRGGRLVCHSNFEKGLGVWIQAAHVVIEEGAELTSNGEGYPPEKGPEAFPPIKSPTPVDHPAAPLALGRGGKGYWGGGAIRLDAATVTLDGLLSSSGPPPVRSWTRGGDGGSIWLTCETLSGKGSIEAKGGVLPPSAEGHAPGTGGRIAVYFRKSSFKGECTASGAGKKGQGDVLIQPRR